jgi:hypothetical protein
MLGIHQVVRHPAMAGHSMLIYKELFKMRAETMKREKYLKSLKNGNEFKKIIG